MRISFPKQLLVWVGVLGLCTPTFGYAQETPTAPPLTLNLEQALQIASSDAHSVQIAGMEVTKARHDRQSAWGKLLPNVSVSGEYGYTIKKPVMYFGSGMKIPGMPASNKGIEVGTTYNVNAGIAAGLPLVNPQLWSSIQLSEEAVKMALLNAEESASSLRLQVTKAYYAALLAQESLEVLRTTQANSLTNYNDIQRKYEQGLVAEYDLVRADVAVKSIEPSLQQAQNGVRATKRQLLLLLSLDTELPLQLVGDLSSHEEEAYRSMGAEAPVLTANPQYQLAEKQVKLSQLQEQLATRAFLPTLSLSGYWRINASNDNFSWKEYQWTPNSALSLSLSIPIFAGGERLGKVRQARLAIQQAQLRLDDALNGLTAQARMFQDNKQAATRKIATSKQAIAQAQKGYEIARKRYDVGMSTLIELNDANLALLQARLNYFEALHDYLSNDADYRKVIGAM